MHIQSFRVGYRREISPSFFWRTLMSTPSFPSADGISRAIAKIDPVFLRSPLLEQSTANAALGCKLLAKIETLNPIRSFKGRGAGWWMANLQDDGRTIVSASAGNFGQGLAYAATHRGRKLVIFSSVNANPLKIAAMRRFGAEVVLQGNDFDAAKLAAEAFAGREGFLFVEDGAERDIAEGAGTIAKELTDSLPGETKLDAVLVPLGNGALLTGIGTWMRHAMPNCKVVGVVAEAAPAMKISWKRERIVTTETARTAADGIAVRVPVPYALRSMRGLVDDIIAVDEAKIQEAMAFCLRHYGVVVEPAGAVGVSALLLDPDPWRGRLVATVLCGGNVAIDV